MVSTPVFQTGYASSILVIGFDKNKNFCYNIIKEVAERNCLTLSKINKTAVPYLSSGKIGRKEN